MKYTLPEISNYGEGSSSNYGAHTLKVTIGPIHIWYSYQTVVAFKVGGNDIVVHENDWGTTTGKHLNWIDRNNKKSRVKHDKFQQLWSEQVEPLLARDEQERKDRFELKISKHSPETVYVMDRKVLDTGNNDGRIGVLVPRDRGGDEVSVTLLASTSPVYSNELREMADLLDEVTKQGVISDGQE